MLTEFSGRTCQKETLKMVKKLNNGVIVISVFKAGEQKSRLRKVFNSDLMG